MKPSYRLNVTRQHQTLLRVVSSTRSFESAKQFATGSGHDKRSAKRKRSYPETVIRESVCVRLAGCCSFLARSQRLLFGWIGFELWERYVYKLTIIPLHDIFALVHCTTFFILLGSNVQFANLPFSCILLTPYWNYQSIGTWQISNILF